MKPTLLVALTALLAIPSALADGEPSSHPYAVSASKSPRPPRAGKLYTATITVGMDGAPIADATVTAKLVIHHRAAPHTARLVKAFFADSAAHVVWRLPKNALNKYITAEVTVFAAGASIGLGSTWNAIVR